MPLSKCRFCYFLQDFFAERQNVLHFSKYTQNNLQANGAEISSILNVLLVGKQRTDQEETWLPSMNPVILGQDTLIVQDKCQAILRCFLSLRNVLRRTGN